MMNMKSGRVKMLTNKTILITGGTGSFGKKFVRRLLDEYAPKKVIIYSRDELKQTDMARTLKDDRMRYFIGDVRDLERLCLATRNVDYIIHAAALKHVPVAEYNPFEAVKTNIIGAQNIILAALQNNVEKVVALSTDKAVSPANLYGATKLSMERLFMAANNYSGDGRTSFSLVRYGNVVGSRGSVIPFFREMVNQGITDLPVTDERMTRFWITLEAAVELVIRAIDIGVGGELLIPKIPSMKITDLVKAFGDNMTYHVVGIRPGEKLHEALISEHESRLTRDLGDIYVILPEFTSTPIEKYFAYPTIQEGTVYSSDINDKWLSVDELRSMIVR